MFEIVGTKMIFEASFRTMDVIFTLIIKTTFGLCLVEGFKGGISFRERISNTKK